MGQISIEWTWVSSLGVELSYRHMYLVYKKTPDAPIEEWTVIRAGPVGFDVLGPMVADVDTPLQSTLDRYADGETPEDRGSRLLYDGAGAWDLWGDMVKVAEDISGRYIYDGGGTFGFDPTLNSNSFIGSVLHHVGIEIEGNEPLGEGTAPGAYNLLGTSADEILQTEGLTDTLFGGGGNDVLLGDERANHLSGGAGDDIFRPGGGGDSLNGGQDGTLPQDDGYDTVEYSSAVFSAGITIDVGVFPEFIDVTSGSSSDTLTSIERIVGTDAVDTLRIWDALPAGLELRIDGLDVISQISLIFHRTTEFVRSVATQVGEFIAGKIWHTVGYS